LELAFTSIASFNKTLPSTPNTSILYESIAGALNEILTIPLLGLGLSSNFDMLDSFASSRIPVSFKVL